MHFADNVYRVIAGIIWNMNLNHWLVFLANGYFYSTNFRLLPPIE